jgi:hypothetical protein
MYLYFPGDAISLFLLAPGDPRRFAMGSGKTKLVLLSFLIMCSSALIAQTSTGTIVGQVTDSSGAVVANARVKLTLIANGTTRDTTTNQTGDFSAPLFHRANTRSPFRLKASQTRH